LDSVQRSCVASANLNRRNLSKGQQAMAYAMLYPHPDTAAERAKKGGEAKAAKAKAASSVSEEAKQPRPSDGRLNIARRVLSHSADLAQEVMAGTESLDEAQAKVDA
jgi:hypothetical protein